MIRCPLCGIRLRDEAPRCPTHGAPAVAPVVEAEAAWDALAPDVREAFLARGYRLTKLLGRGGFGVVVGAVRASDGLEVALKVTFPEQPLGVEQLAREADFLARVGPPTVPALYETGSVLGRPYVAIELLRGETLADALIAAEGPMPLTRFGMLADAILQAVATVHQHGIAHRDLKPENIFFHEEGERVSVRLIDFGLANDASMRSAERPEPNAPPSDDDAIGTAEYMSPEQCEGASDTDARSDQYSLGALFFELITGAPPFWGKSADVREAQRSRRPALLSAKVSCPPSLDQVIRRCLAKDRALRFADVEALRAALSIALSEAAPAPRAATQQLAAVAPPREKRTMGLLFFESSSGLQAVQALITSSGGQIVQTTGAQYVAAFGHDVGDNPVRSAFAAAQRLALGKLTKRALVDVAPISVQQRPDGSKRLFSAVFTKKDRYPADTDPAGITFTGPATEVMPDLTVVPVPNRSDRFLVSAAAQSDATVYGQHTLVGQDQRLSNLRESALTALTRSEPTLVSVLAGAGYGKTHVARALEQMLERLVADIDVVRLAGQESMVGASSQLLPELLRRALRVTHEAPLDPEAVLRARYGELDQRHWVGAAFALGWIDSEHPQVRKLAAAPGALRLAAARATGEAMRLHAQRAPLAVVIDDAHLADDAALDAIEYATMREAHARIWVCVLARPSFLSARPAWGARAAKTLQTVLEALSSLEAADLARRLLHPVEQVPPMVLNRLAERTQGVPRLLVELIRGLKRDGIVRRNERGTGHYLAIDELDKLPDIPIVQWNATREIEALPPQLAAHARLSSVLGNGFTAAELESLLEKLDQSDAPDEAQLDASVGVARLVEAGLLVRHRTGLLDFRHSLLRDTIYQMLPEPQQKRLHHAAYEMYQGFPMGNEQRLPRLALHAARCGQSEVAASLYLELAERARKAHAYYDAEVAYGQALANVAEADRTRIVISARGRGTMRTRLGRHEEAQRDLKRAREQAGNLGELATVRDLLLDEATVLDWLRDFPGSAALVRDAAETPGEMSALTQVKLAVGLARSRWRVGDAEGTVRLGAEAEARAHALGDEGYESRLIALLMLGTECASLGRYEDSARYLELAISEARAHADLLHVSAALVNRGFLSYLTQNVQQFFEDMEQASHIARELGDGTVEWVSLNNSGETAYAIDDIARARSANERALQLARSLWGETSRDYLTSVMLAARIALHEQALDETRAVYDQLITRAREAESRGDVEAASATDQAMLDAIELGLRGGSPDAWRALEARAQAGDVPVSERIEILQFQAAEALRAGRADESRHAFQRALELHRESPSLIGPRVQTHFARAFPG
ncbi:MAG TPA: protein kinase [Polyangiales bacterium]|nr:protein kinase [Polyangiales bacterium]